MTQSLSHVERGTSGNSAEQDADPDTVQLPLLLPAGSGRAAESGVWLVPLTVLAAVGAGELLRAHLLLDQAARTTFAIVALLVVFAAVAVLAATLNRGGRG